MSIEAELRAEHERSMRLEGTVITFLPYALLVVSTLIALTVSDTFLPLAVVVTLVAVTALWLVWFLSLHRRWHSDPRLMGVYFGGLMVLAAALVISAPFYGIFAFVGYIHTTLFLSGRWQYLGAAATSMIMALSYLGGPGSISTDREWVLWLAISGISTVLSVTFIHFAETSYARGLRQRDALAQLHEANVRLEAALEENAGLHAQLVNQAREAGVLDERQRMAGEIHDTLAQSLAGILTQLEAADQTRTEPDRSRHMASAITLARDSLVEARRTVHAVQPLALAEARLPDAIQELANRWSETHPTEAMLTTTGNPIPLHTDIEVALLRAAQEALANVAKHAEASRVGLTLSYMEDLVTLDVRDDGVGFDPLASRPHGSPAGGYGLAAMRHRIQRLTGRLEVESEPGGGTAISVSLPAIPTQESVS